MSDLNALASLEWQIPVGIRVQLKSCGFRQDGCLRQHPRLDGVLHDRFLISLLAEDRSE